MRLGLILGDQLTLSLPTLMNLDRSQDRIIMAEVMEEATYVPHHPQKVALLFSAMRHFAEELRDAGWTVDYHSYDPDSDCKSLLDITQNAVKADSPESLLITHCGEYRLQQAFEDTWPGELGIPVEILDDERFFCSPAQFRRWAEERNSLLMEYFYRDMRRRSGYLMDGDKPAGDRWNFDQSNRKAWKGDPPIPDPPTVQRDDIDNEVLALVEKEFGHHTGNLQPFLWGTRRSQAKRALDFFIEECLPCFGDYQDAMARGESRLFHSLLSPYLNCGLLTAKQVCDAAEKAWMSGDAPLNAVEGFIRQILGWREYVRGIYWLKMPDYARENRLGNTRDLPRYYWDGKTNMACMSDCFQNTFDHAYAHHIQRLMVTGNFALITGIKPEAICDWYLAVYADAYDWVELPNTLGMVMHADGGYLGSKPYAASGNYIHKMSDYCRHCHYNVKTRSEHDSCPFNSLYWHFIHRHREEFSGNQRMSMIYRSFDRMKDDEKDRTLARAEQLLNNLDDL